MPDWKAALTKKIGPLPAWGWGAVVGGGYIGYRVLSGKGISLSGASTDTATNPGDSGIGTGGSGSTSQDYLQFPGNPSVPASPAPVSPDVTALINQLTAESEKEGKYQRAYNTQKSKVTRVTKWGKRWKAIAKSRSSANAKRANNKKPKTKLIGTSQAGHKPKKAPTPKVMPHHKIAASAAPQRVRNRAPLVLKSNPRKK